MNRKNTRAWCRLYPCQEVGARTCSLFRYAGSLNHFPFFFSIVYPTEYFVEYSFRSRTFNYTVIQTASSTWYFFGGCLHWKVDRNKSFPVYWTWKNLEFTREHLFSLSCATSLVFSVSYTSSTHFTRYRLKFIEQKWFVSRGGGGIWNGKNWICENNIGYKREKFSLLKIQSSAYVILHGFNDKIRNF